MSRFLKFFGILIVALLILVPAASAQRGFGGRGFGHEGFYGRGFYGGGWGWYGPGWGWGWYSPYGYGDGYPYGYDGAYAPGPRYGDVKITDTAKDALVYIDGAYAGKAGDLKKFHLTTGDHSIELRDPSGHTFHQEEIQVLPGKTLEIQGNVGGH